MGIVLQESVWTLVSRAQAVLARLFHFWVLRIVVSAELLILDMQESEQRLRNTVDLRVQRIRIAISFV